MTTTARAVAGLVACAALLLGGCGLAGPDRSAEAEDLEQTLGDLSGVAKVTLDYVEPVTLDPADVNLRVRMADAATPEDVAAVFEAAYEGLVNEHHGEEGNLDVRHGDDRLELRVFEPEAAADDVAEAALVGARQARDYRRVYVHVTTQDVAREPYVESLFLVRLPRGTSDRGASAVRSAIEDAYDGLLVTVDVRVPRQRP
ncbi:hypothetical protein [Nocardioides sp. TF02-7]|uniref:hypothetical protein n=1 Tax=Nocardioides sp. TF02-7 TaxID=2917724 RepID=UPI001F065A13|nr:hypothetical protein [Nocardioides sp. TF02-7]UMG94554.1 hypothetical protein MF408_11720 [Nocardioides sp. TF02-7]